MNKNYGVRCGCYDCDLEIELPPETVRKINKNRYRVLVDGCPNGPSNNDTLVEERPGYSLYKGKYTV